ncbi:MAG: D-alanyl-D-alanine carboxypeptidase [Cyanobacteria bacterium P01_A01_bin.135]
MFELIAAGLLATQGQSPALLQSSNLATWLDQGSARVLLEPQNAPDAGALDDLQTYLSELGYFGWIPRDQAVWVQSSEGVLASHQGKVPLPAASLTKIATTLVALTTWGSNHRFETTVSATGPIESGVLQGDLVVQGGSNPLFVWEEAIALANALQDLGIRQVTGQLIITGPFSMNYEEDPLVAGRLLRQAFDSRSWSGEVAQQYALMPADTPRPTLRVSGGITALSPAQAASLSPQRLAVHYSLPLDQLLRLMNLYSNNFMADLLAVELGGGTGLSRQVATLTGVPQPEVQLINGSGLGVENRLSARAAVAMLRAVEARLISQGLGVMDVFPVAGIDVGTLKGRNLPEGTSVKTGTLAAVSALAGVMPTRDRGTVWFAIINQNGNLVELRAQQDYFLEDLADRWGFAEPSDRPQRQVRLGDPARVEAATAPLAF